MGYHCKCLSAFLWFWWYVGFTYGVSFAEKFYWFCKLLSVFWRLEKRVILPRRRKVVWWLIFISIGYLYICYIKLTVNEFRNGLLLKKSRSFAQKSISTSRIQLVIFAKLSGILLQVAFIKDCHCYFLEVTNCAFWIFRYSD